MGTYKKTHPWITFDLDLRRIPASLWVKLGEAQSKCEHLAGVPLRPDTARELHQIYLAKGAAASTGIEGNTLSEEQVLQHLEGKLELPPSKEYLAKEIDNIILACNTIAESIIDAGTFELSSEQLQAYNEMVLNGLELDEDVVPGQFRKHNVGVMRYRAPPWKECPGLMPKLCSWINGFPQPEGQKVVYGLLKAIIAHLYIAWIHPFGDGNGRTARLVELEVLLSCGVPMPAAHLLSNHYNMTRTEYYRQLDRASKSGGDIIPFIEYAVQGFIDGLREQIERIQSQQWDVTWRNLVHELFRDKTGATAQRRRHLALDLSLHTDPVPMAEVSMVSPRLIKAYHGKTQKTVARDINALVGMGLIEKRQGTVRAKREVILAFLPKRLDPASK